MKRLNTTYGTLFRNDYDTGTFIADGCIDAGHGAYAYAAEWDAEWDDGETEHCVVYCFAAPEINEFQPWDSEFMERYHSMFTYMQGLALELQKDVGGYVTWEEEPEALTFFVCDFNSMKALTWGWDWRDDMWELPENERYRLTSDYNAKEFDANKRNLLKLGEE